jgi:hypothetical protein
MAGATPASPAALVTALSERARPPGLERLSLLH